MKNRVKLLYCLCLLVSGQLWAQTSDLRFELERNDGIIYDVLIQIKGSSEYKIGTSNITFNFNNLAIGGAIILQPYNFNSNQYQPLTLTQPFSNLLSLNIVLNDINDGSLVSTNWTDIATIRFTTIDPFSNSDLRFRSVSPNRTGIFHDDNFSLELKGVWYALNTYPLPVELTSFTVQTNENKAMLKWNTISELNSDGFEVERRDGDNESITNNSEWLKIGFVKGAENSNSIKQYSFIDDQLNSGKYLFRLKIIDTDGSYKYSETIRTEISSPMKFLLGQNYPNPFNPTTKITYHLPEDSRVSLKVYSILGESIVKLVDEYQNAGYYNVGINFDKLGLSSGLYIYILETFNPQNERTFFKTMKMNLIK